MVASTYLFLTGFEMGHTGILDTIVNSPSASAAQARSGSYSFYCDNYLDGGRHTLSDDYTTLYAGVAFRPAETGHGSSGNAILSVLNSDNECQAYLGFDNSGSTLCIYTVSGASITKVATGSALSLNTWYYIDVLFTIDGSSGVITVLLDGVQDSTFSGDTAGSAPNSIRAVALSNPDATSYTPYNGVAGYYDDFLIASDARVGRCSVELLSPDGAGNSTDLTPSAGDNYAAVDEVPPDDDTTYVSGSSVDDHDTYTLSDTTIVGTVAAVQWFARAKLADAGDGNIARVVRISSTDYTGDDLGLDTSYAYKTDLMNTSPATSSAWTTGELDGTEAGPKIR